MFFLKLVETFQRHAIEYAVTGGYAAALHGYVQNVRDVELVTENSLLGLIEMQTALEECGLKPEKYSAQSICKVRNTEPTWLFVNPNDESERVIIHVQLDIEDCRSVSKSIYGNKIDVMTVHELQKKLNFQIAETKLMSEKSFSLKPIEILQILEDFRTLKNINSAQAKDKSILISIKIPQSLLEQFKDECAGEGLKYQTQIKNLMKSWLR